MGDFELFEFEGDILSNCVKDLHEAKPNLPKKGGLKRY